MIKVKIPEDNFSYNTLGNSSSPYLLQHAVNPVWWQEWNLQTTGYALSENKPILVSIGYSTCHWCHVMAAEAFSDIKTADYLNNHFVCIKVDREQRPDIDQFMMSFIFGQSGSGGWPLNVFLTPDLKPFFALTYAPVVSDGRSISFLDLAERIYNYFEAKGSAITPFLTEYDFPDRSADFSPARELLSYFDGENGGFGFGQKFPPHSSLLSLLYSYPVNEDPEIKSIIIQTLDTIRLRGLNDHLQGGIFRYCVDRKWTIPHFEKMLYDQVLALWTYSLAYKVFGDHWYIKMAEKIIACLDECFELNGLYISAFNADTAHEEGATYLWSHEEIAALLTQEEFLKFKEVYEISAEGNFEGENHLIRKNSLQIDDIERKLLSARKMRIQPSSDDKVICGLNALAAIALVNAGRFIGRPDLEEKSAGIINQLLKLFWDGSSLGHSFYKGKVQKQSFLSDAGAMLLAITFLYENDNNWESLMNDFSHYINSFKENGKWIESRSDDFQTVFASCNDQPIPSGLSLAETGLARAALLTGKDTDPIGFGKTLQSDFFNIAAMIRNGLFHIYTVKNRIPWNMITPNSLQRTGEPETDCFNSICSVIDSKKITDHVMLKTGI